MGNLFLKHAHESNALESANWGDDIMAVPEKEVATELFFGLLSTYLATVYVIPKGNVNADQGLDNQTAEIYFNGILNQTRERLKKSEEPQTKVRLSTRAAA